MVDVTNHLNTLNKGPREKGTMAQQLLEHVSVFEDKLKVSLRDVQGRKLSHSHTLRELTILSCHSPGHRPIPVEHVCIDRRKST